MTDTVDRLFQNDSRVTYFSNTDHFFYFSDVTYSGEERAGGEGRAGGGGGGVVFQDKTVATCILSTN